MPKLSEKETVIVAILSMMIFMYASETAAKLDQEPNFNYLNTTYIFMVMTAITSLSTTGYLILKLHYAAKKRVEALKQKRLYGAGKSAEQVAV